MSGEHQAQPAYNEGSVQAPVAHSGTNHVHVEDHPVLFGLIGAGILFLIGATIAVAVIATRAARRIDND